MKKQRYSKALRRRHNERQEGFTIINPKNRTKISVYLQPDSLKLCDTTMQTDNCRSRSEYIEKAIRFYSGYLNAGNNTDFLCEQIAQTVSAIISNTENRLARMQFKEAVELAKLTHMVAPLCDLDDEDLRKLHVACVDEVKRINGALRLDRAVEDARGE